MSASIEGYCQVKDYPFSRLNDQDGLSDNHINVIFKDRQGFVWVGTNSGLNRYDGYNFKVFRHDDRDSTSLSDELVEGIFQGPEDKLYVTTAGGISIYDPSTGAFLPHIAAYLQARNILSYGLIGIVHCEDDRYYFVYRDSGLYRYDPGQGAVRVRSAVPGAGGINSPVADVAVDRAGGIWLSEYNGILQRFDPGSQTISMVTDILQRSAQRAPSGYKMFLDREDRLWLYAQGNLSGLWVYDQHTGGLRHLSRDSGVIRLSSNNISDVIEDGKGQIWVATDQGGLDILDMAQGVVRNLRHSDEDRSLSENTVTTLYIDDIGAVWIGTLKNGVCYYQQHMLRFPLYRRQPGQPESLPYDDVNCFAEDARGNLWIGTDGGGLIYFDRAGNKFKQYRHEQSDLNSLGSDVLVSLLLDHRGILWIGTYQGGLDRYDGRTFTHYRHSDTDPASLADNRVYSLREDGADHLWVGTMAGGLDRFDEATGKFYHNTPDMPRSIHSDYVPALAEDSASNLWIATAYGLDELQRNTGQYVHYIAGNSRLSDNTVFSLTCDHLGNIWVGTRQGLSVIQPGKDTFQSYTIKDGLPSNTILSVLEDKAHFLWVSTSAGISRISISREGAALKIRCLNFDEYDGLQGREFNANTAFRTREGELIFGGPKGFNLFRPESIQLNEHIPPVVLTGLQLYNKETPLPASVPMDGKLVLSYDENNFILEFAALSYINARKNRYAYQLVGFDKDWMMTDGHNRRAAYTNIDPGEYVFRVRASNSDGVWNEQGISIRVIIKPPFWKTTIAYILYVLLALAILYASRMRIIRRARARFALAEERREAIRVRELDRMKIKFFTNLSHEFRTPLSLILSPVDKLIRSSGEPGHRQLAMTIERNARRLLHLVNQLLDLRKMEVNELKLNMSRGDIASFIKATTQSFADLAEERGIGFTYQGDTEYLPALFDKDKVERILFNLLSNAFKFTSPGGSIGVEFTVLEKDEQGALLQLKVKDTGIGIPADQQEKIFESFFQGELPGHVRSQGTGIGLAITREFVEMHGGTIKVESAPDMGSCFTILLPVTVLPGGSPEPAVPIVADDADGANISAPSQPREDGTKQFKVLLVEDDEDFRFYLKDNLAPLFTVLEAANGREGWQKALSAQPELVVSDVNMPLMDGLELCKKIKSDERTRHIPVILLTALSDEQDQLRALGIGANDYISKPFNVEILVSRIRNLLEFKDSVEETLKRRVVAEPGEIEAEPEKTEEDFIREAVDVLEKNIANADFSVDEWSREMGLSRTTLYKRILAATGKTPIGFIRHFRMKRAAQLLEKTQHNIAEVAYMVGFNNPKYFARYFKEVYGVLPSVYQSEKRKKK
ncbi:hybrid sensor histidine kinase/response regulator transcription factor [Puia dinghuensis]|uniref:histidine kinase n=1 Tax=Puia dinghuensis TaxID=1792502 RepID=A0A8J2U6F2_9BACT|nr:two-component regulator propeller domain-containing protein [Puia dinghuensis]GGA81814.1 hybrid sensor histidine kinase/response regulator [Puia dinghuensis]